LSKSCPRNQFCRLNIEAALLERLFAFAAMLRIPANRPRRSTASDLLFAARGLIARQITGGRITEKRRGPDGPRRRAKESEGGNLRGLLHGFLVTARMDYGGSGTFDAVLSPLPC
jgi:hypothetical protein